MAEYIVPFSGGLNLAGDSDPITIWAPVLGEGQAVVLEKIYSTLAPAEVKPFLPAPSRMPRRGDELVSEYSSLLFGTWGVDPRGFMYANESDPFDIYRLISVDWQRTMLTPWRLSARLARSYLHMRANCCH